MKKAHHNSMGLLHTVLGRLEEGYAATEGESIVLAPDSSRGRAAK